MANVNPGVLSDAEKHLLNQALVTYAGVLGRRVNAEVHPQIKEILKAQAREVEALRLKV